MSRGLRIVHSNRLEALAGALAALLRAEPGDPLAPERIVVPHGTVERWLRLQLARALGIAANLEFELPAAFAWSVMRSAVPELPKEQPFAPAQLRWRIHEVLPRFAEQERHGEAVRRYLADGDPRKRFALADRLARVFDRCVVYRPDWIRAWEGGDAPNWQARLWRQVAEAVAEGSATHWVRAIDTFHGALEGSERPEGWPLRATFFAVSALSPSYLDVLGAIGRRIDLRLFMLNPCREYWGDIHSRREIGRRAAGEDPAERYFSEGNELLAAWGRSGRDTFDALVEAAEGDWEERFVRPGGAHRLAAVQRDVLDLRLASEGAADEAANPEPDAGSGAGAGDDSIRIHVCHSPVREVEVLHDRLLGLFDTHPGIGPADILILAPNLDVYGPTVEAVFGAAGRIPVHVARQRFAASPAARAFFELLAMRRSRLGAEAVLAPLDAEAVRARFGIAASGLPAIRDWVREAGIRWGVDAGHRAAEGLPATGDHAWRQGLRRLLLGHALPNPNELVAGVVPCPPRTGGFDPGADEAELLGRFVTWCEAVFALRARLEEERPPREWARVLREEIDRFFVGGGAGPGTEAGSGARVGAAAALAEEVSEVRGLVNAFAREVEGTDVPIGSDVVHDVLLDLAEAPSREAVRLDDAVTVTSLTPGQVFPAEVVCVIGLNDGAFPRSPSFPSFDLVAVGPARRGDRDIRREDRFVFLEALLAARRAFLVSYTGRGQRDDAPLPPAAVVDELKDYLGQRFPGGSFETRHPLQPFSPRYFVNAGVAGEGPDAKERSVVEPRGSGAGDLYSYSEAMCEAARSLVSSGPQSTASARFEASLPKPAASPGFEESLRRLAFGDLVAFFANPARWFLRERLGVRLELDDASLEDEEPFELDHLNRYRLRSEILDRMRAGTARPRDEALRRGSGRLPQAALGSIAHGRVWEEVQCLHRALDAHRGALEAPPVEIDVEAGGWRVAGPVGNVGPEGLVWWRPGRLRERDRFEIRLAQLALAATGAGASGALALSLENNRAKITRFAVPEDPGGHLAQWIDAWEKGHAGLLPLFPKASFAYANALLKGEGRTGALARARAAWFGTSGPWGSGGEADADPYLLLVHDGRDPLTEEFEALAADLLVPLAEAAQ